MELKFNEEYSEKLKGITRYYGVAKELVLFAEEIDPEKRTHLQTIKELRDALDHLMRVLALEFGLRQLGKGQSKDDYILVNLDKALGHIYRACYDALDWISINLRNEIRNELEGFSNEAIKEVIPNYYSEIGPFIEKVNREISELRATKDIGSPNVKSLENYRDIVKKLRDHYKTIIQRKPALIEYQSRQKKERILKSLGTFVLGILITVIGGAILFVLGFI